MGLREILRYFCDFVKTFGYENDFGDIFVFVLVLGVVFQYSVRVVFLWLKLVGFYGFVMWWNCICLRAWMKLFGLELML